MNTIYDIGPFRLDTGASVLTKDGVPTSLGPRAIAVLATLVGRKGEYLPKDSIISAAWPGVVVEECNLPVQISTIRRVLSQAPGGERWIETLTKRGYRFVGPAVAATWTPSDVPGPRKRSNLTEPLTSFIGRERELVELKRLLPGKRLLTIVGMGGIGKTRFALQTAAEVMDAYRDGVWLVELGAIHNPMLVAKSVARVLGVQELSGTPLVETLCEQLAARQVLLILDNCEHLLEASARLTDSLLRNVADVTIVATSREPLHVAGEQIYALPPLSLPESSAAPEAVGRSEAVQLFVERARRQLPSFEMTVVQAAIVARLCTHLDGIPLALELAAARMRSLTVDQIASRLHDRFRLLTSSDRMASPRQQTLRALLDWSYELLTQAEKSMMRTLSVFAGGWTLEAAERVCDGDALEQDEVLDLIASLCDKSLVVVEQKDNHLRYRLLETVRRYAADRLQESGNGTTVGVRHCNYFVDLAEAAEPNLHGADQAEWLRHLEEEHENLRAALEWSVDASASGVGLRLCGVLQRFWITRGHISEGREWCSRVLRGNRDGATLERAKALNTAGILAFYQSDYAVARVLHGESLAIRRKLDSPKDIAVSLNNLGNVLYEEGDYAAARTIHEESLAIKRGLHDRRGIAASLNNLGNVALDQCEFASARMLYEECLGIMRDLGDPGDTATCLCNLGIVLYEQGDYSKARLLQEESLAIKQEIGDRAGIANSLNNLGNLACDEREFVAARALHQKALAIDRELGDKWGIAFSLEGLAAVAAGTGRLSGAIRLWSSAERLRTEVGSPLPPNDRARYRNRLDAARDALADDAMFALAWDEGRALLLEQAIALALSDVTE